VPELAFPTPRPQQLGFDVSNRRRKNSLKEVVGSLPDHLLCCPSVHFLRPTIPVSNDSVHIADENGVVCEIQQARLLCSLRYFGLEFVAGLKELSLDAVPNSAETCDQQRKTHQDHKGWNVSNRECKAVNGWSEEIYEAKNREYGRQRSRSHTCVPGRKGYSEQEEREFPIVKVVVLQEKRR
jgi:hypothetical protein